MILTHGSNSISRGSLGNFHLLTYLNLDGNGNPICIKGEYIGNSAQSSYIIPEGVKQTPFGTMNFITGNPSDSQWRPAIPFKYKSDEPSYSKTHPIQIELISKPIADYGIALNCGINQYIFGWGSDFNGLDVRIQSYNASVFPVAGISINKSFPYSGNPGPGSYYGELTGSTSLVGQYHHLCCVFDYDKCSFYLWVDGIYYGYIVVNQQTMSYYSGDLNRINLYVNERSESSQLCVKDAEWEPNHNYTPPTQPYAI